MYQPDLHVSNNSQSLTGIHLDVIVSGSIGATESLKFIRALRRLGAEVTPWLTEGGAQFTTPMALTWAAGREVVQTFDGLASHLAENDGCIIAPGSANIIAAIAGGLTSTPATALIQSYLGQGKPVGLVPNMHQSLFDSPFVQKNIKSMQEFVTVLEPRSEEGKLKFPDPIVLADEVSHFMKSDNAKKSVMITLGSTKGYIDDVRYVSNYSSGKLGSIIAEEFYRNGFTTHVVLGSSKFRPTVYSTLVEAEENALMQEEVVRLCDTDLSAAVMLASVLDFVPAERLTGKTRSKDGPLTVQFENTPKIISMVPGHSDGDKPFRKIGFKLEIELNDEKIKSIAEAYFAKYSLSLLVLNELASVSENRHQAYIVTRNKNEDWTVRVAQSKQEIASCIVNYISE